jgi:antitoxin ParD1/3/4
MTTNVSLTADLEQFARNCVESGRYNNVSEVVRSALRLLQDTEQRRLSFGKMLNEVRAEAERAGVRDVDTVAAEMDTIIASTR